MISYEPLWKTMREKEISVYYLTEIKEFSKKSMYNIQKGKNVTLLTLEKLCNLLNCRIGDVVEFVPDPKQKNAGAPSGLQP